MTSSTGCNGLTLLGSPPRRTMPSRMAARSTTHGTPVKSCSRTRAGMNEISRCAALLTSHLARASMSAVLTNRPSSFRSRFSRRIFSEYGRRDTSGNPAAASAGRLYTWIGRPAIGSAWRVPKLFTVGMNQSLKTFIVPHGIAALAARAVARAHDESVLTCRQEDIHVHTNVFNFTFS